MSLTYRPNRTQYRTHLLLYHPKPSDSLSTTYVRPLHHHHHHHQPHTSSYISTQTTLPSPLLPPRTHLPPRPPPRPPPLPHPRLPSPHLHNPLPHPPPLHPPSHNPHPPLRSLGRRASSRQRTLSLPPPPPSLPRPTPNPGSSPPHSSGTSSSSPAAPSPPAPLPCYPTSRSIFWFGPSSQGPVLRPCFSAIPSPGAATRVLIAAARSKRGMRSRARGGLGRCRGWRRGGCWGVGS